MAEVWAQVALLVGRELRTVGRAERPFLVRAVEEDAVVVLTLLRRSMRRPRSQRVPRADVEAAARLVPPVGERTPRALGVLGLRSASPAYVAGILRALEEGGHGEESPRSH